MRVKGMILGVTNRSGEKDGKKYDFTTVNVVDTENPQGSTFEMSLPKGMSADSFHQSRMKVMEMNIHLNGKYVNFESFCQKAA
jgi:hypothetical protein